jgi:hypothetical protein
MRLDCGPTRTAEPVQSPDNSPARRSRGPVGIIGLVIAILGITSLGISGAHAAAAADTPPPAQPQPVLILNDDCTATLSLVDLVVGRAYDISIVDGAGTSVLDLRVVADDTVLDSFATVPSGTHELTVTDAEAPEFTAGRSIQVAPCETPTPTTTADVEPQSDPTLVATAHDCDLLGATDVRVDATGLGSGAYPVGVAVDGAAVPGVDDIELTAANSSAVIPDVPNGESYVVWMKDSTGGVVSADSVNLPTCDLPTLPEPETGAVQPPTDGATPTPKADAVPAGSLAATGSELVPGAVLSALAALQVGALIAGTAILRGRGRGEHRA